MAPPSFSIWVALARLGPIGRIPFAPGTWGSVVGVGLFGILFPPLSDVVSAAVAVGFCALAIPVCSRAEEKLGQRDPGEVVLDEVVAIPLCFLGWSRLSGAAPAWAVLAAGFTLFRVFDILKPLGIRKLQDLPGGWGVVADDVAAGLLTCGLLHAARLLWFH